MDLPSNSYAVLMSGGKQLRVVPEQKVLVEKIHHAVGSSVSLDGLVFTVEGEKFSAVNAKVDAVVVENVRAAKIVGLKKKRRKGYKRKFGHKQHQTCIQIKKIG
jgi:large subunit ribosomal protein L21